MEISEAIDKTLHFLYKKKVERFNDIRTTFAEREVAKWKYEGSVEALEHLKILMEGE